MNDLNQNTTNNQVQTPQTAQQAPNQEVKNDWKTVLSTKLLPLLKDVGRKVYSNKKIFWLIITLFSLIFLITIVGIIFGNKRGKTSQQALPTPTATPVVQENIQASPSGDILIDSQTELNKLKNQIKNLDVKQSKLQPPSVDFEIKI